MQGLKTVKLSDIIYIYLYIYIYLNNAKYFSPEIISKCYFPFWYGTKCDEKIYHLKNI